MKIRLFWPGCDFLKKRWTDQNIDSYWIECTFDEAQNKIYQYLSAAQKAESQKYWEPNEEGSDIFKDKRNFLCFLVSKDLYSIEPFPWYYPYSGQWGAYCPFEAIEEMNINDLNEVRFDTDDKGEQNV